LNVKTESRNRKTLGVIRTGFAALMKYGLERQDRIKKQKNLGVFCTGFAALM
jgi:hypothetical protein